ncbi:MAG: NAD(+) diphosphatase [Proteobacteria bacterium]|nr:NAD(+) diphosphatase [Pseudomonadota bacterium]
MVKNLKYAGVALDRASALRRDETWVAERLGDPATLVAPVWRGLNLFKSDSMPQAVFLNGTAAQTAIKEAGAVVLLGLDGNTAYAAADLSGLDEYALAPFTDTGGFEDLRRVGALMAGPEGALLAYARGMVHWHQKHMFCGVCGAPTTNRDGGLVRICDGRGDGGDDTHMHFPRTDPAVIMLVTHDNPEGNGPACLLGRQRRWVNGMYSTLAGFVEPGETLEEAVAREVLEESDIRVTDVQYMASQPWPFPSSLMLGFRARAETTKILIDARELEDARWFTADEMLGFGEWGDEPPGNNRMPRTDSIARWLMDGWLKEVRSG